MNIYLCRGKIREKKRSTTEWGKLCVCVFVYIYIYIYISTIYIYIYIYQQQIICVPFLFLKRGVICGFPHQSFPFYLILCIYLIQPTLISCSTSWFHVILGLPLPLTPSTSYDMFIFTHSSSSFRNKCPKSPQLIPFNNFSLHSLPKLHTWYVIL